MLNQINKKIKFFDQQIIQQNTTKDVHITSEERKNIMRTIADKYIDEGIQKGMVQGIEVGKQQGVEIGKQAGITEGIQIGEARGKAEGKAEGMVEAMKSVAKTMLMKKKSLDEIMEVTGLSNEQIQQLKNN